MNDTCAVTSDWVIDYSDLAFICWCAFEVKYDC